MCRRAPALSPSHRREPGREGYFSPCGGGKGRSSCGRGAGDKGRTLPQTPLGMGAGRAGCFCPACRPCIWCERATAAGCSSARVAQLARLRPPPFWIEEFPTLIHAQYGQSVELSFTIRVSPHSETMTLRPTIRIGKSSPRYRYALIITHVTPEEALISPGASFLFTTRIDTAELVKAAGEGPSRHRRPSPGLERAMTDTHPAMYGLRS
jgi:hypothetical protein